MADQKTSIIIQGVDNTRAAVESAKAGLTGLERTSSTLNSTLARLAPLIGAASFKALIKGAIDSADAMNDLSTRTGISVEEIGAWKLATEQSGTSIEALVKALEKGSRYIVEHGDKLKSLGLSAKTSKELIFQLAGALEKLPSDDPRRVALAMNVLGKSAGELMPLLSEGEAGLRKMVETGEELNPVTAEFARQSDKFNDQLAELGVLGSSLGVTLAEVLIPAMSILIKELSDSAKEGGAVNLIFSGIAEIFKVVVVLGANVGYVFKEVGNELGGMVAQVDRLAHGDMVGFNAISAAMKKDAAEARKEIDAFSDHVINGFPKDGSGASVPKKTDTSLQHAIDSTFAEHGPKGPKPEIAHQAAEEYAKLWGEFTKIIDGTAELSKSEQVLRDIQSGRFNDLLPWQQEQLADLAREVTLNEQLASFQKIQEEGDERQQEMDQAAADASEADDQKRLDAAQELLLQLEQGNEDKNAALIKDDTKRALAQAKIENDRAIQHIYDLGIETDAVQEQLDQQAESYRLQQEEIAQNSHKSIDLVKELGLTFTSSFENAITTGGKLSDIIRGLGQDTVGLLARKYVTEPFANAFNSLFPSADGNAFNSSGLIPFATGGIVDSATPFMFGNGGRLGVMGEAGPEAILPLKRGANGQLGVQSGGGSGGTVITVNVDATGSQVEGDSDKSAQLGKMLGAAVQAEILKQKRLGGLLG